MEEAEESPASPPSATEDVYMGPKDWDMTENTYDSDKKKVWFMFASKPKNKALLPPLGEDGTQAPERYA